ncbi:MAG: hypothetical protein EBR82_27930, partial [Caulobacteraceae bacterium]|nr:hypothetical protein [Caulobacteraceae bacterium]
MAGNLISPEATRELEETVRRVLYSEMPTLRTQRRQRFPPRSEQSIYAINQDASIVDGLQFPEYKLDFRDENGDEKGTFSGTYTSPANVTERTFTANLIYTTTLPVDKLIATIPSGNDPYTDGTFITKESGLYRVDGQVWVKFSGYTGPTSFWRDSSDYPVPLSNRSARVSMFMGGATQTQTFDMTDDKHQLVAFSLLWYFAAETVVKVRCQVDIQYSSAQPSFVVSCDLGQGIIPNGITNIYTKPWMLISK